MAKLNVWIVSSDISYSDVGIPDIFNDSAGLGVAGRKMRATIVLKHIIKPSTIITAPDHPNLDQAVPEGGPGGPVLCDTDPKRGANYRWDVTRQVYISYQQNPPFTLTLDCAAQTFTQPPTDNVVANDDGKMDGEVNDPYRNSFLSDPDNPATVIPAAQGTLGDAVTFTHHFREFTRLK